VPALQVWSLEFWWNPVSSFKKKKSTWILSYTLEELHIQELTPIELLFMCQPLSMCLPYHCLIRFW
jgi:hypothetical protein